MKVFLQPTGKENHGDSNIEDSDKFQYLVHARWYKINGYKCA